MLGFSKLSKPIKWQDLLEKGKNGRNAFRTGAKIHFSKKKKKNGGYGHSKDPTHYSKRVGHRVPAVVV